jgi:hypothetical protein
MEEFPEKTPLLLRPLSNRKQSMDLYHFIGEENPRKNKLNK